MVLYHVFLGDAAVKPATYEVYTLVNETAHIGARLRAQTQRQPTLPVALLHLLQTDFNEIFCQALERWQRVRWTYFERLRRDLVNGNFRPDITIFPGASTPQFPGA